MKLTTRGRYGLRALIDLAVNEENGAVSTQSIAERQAISESYLEQLIRMLKKDGLVTSVRGAGGGYHLARPASEISVGDILRCLEGGIDAVACPANEGSSCEEADACVTKFVWKRINDAIADAVDSILLSELADESRRMREKSSDAESSGGAGMDGAGSVSSGRGIDGAGTRGEGESGHADPLEALLEKTADGTTGRTAQEPSAETRVVSSIEAIIEAGKKAGK